ncbi:hypothetical protein GUY44_22430 [Pimelobacter simplex]|uniref:Uncharacterized protein n=1 Tax=Nocardioides simplex TaxID=2045 RepID=A0A0A1DPW4_NOCSI|nr:hypothetical protein [Pimelobacter simplex]AIY18568.1 hypothetical protein KR76_20655 [Pimelobacter simplex]MCG8153256.1 hypothetical protein [Pimelobacter simplex]SFM32438.1 hypothetical protein SAMN05421671_1213 [Pimelobacter simplex]
MQPRHVWTAGGLTLTALVTLLVTRRQSLALEIIGDLWPWLTLGAWIVLTLTGMWLAGWAWRSWRRFVAALVAAVLLGGLGAWALQPSAPRLGVLRDREAWFEAHRADFTAAVARGTRSDAYYGSRLPDDLRYLTIDGRFSVGDGGALFFPQWIAIPDDAGGYWYSPDVRPAGYDMYGMWCEDPVDLGDGWWSCGM